MRIEKLNENKIRFILNMDDLKEKHIDFHDFMSNSIESQNIFLDMLDQAEEKIGFKTDNYKLMIEALVTPDSNFILTVTRLPEEAPKKVSKKPVKVNGKKTSPNKSLSIYQFKTFDDFCNFCTYLVNILPNNLSSRFKNSSLYLYNSTYYLILQNLRMNTLDFNVFCSAITEFGTFVKCPNLVESKIKEYGKLIINNYAISTSLKYFS